MENTYAALLRHLIKFSGIKLSSLADFIGYDVSYISKWCNNINHPSSKYLTRINTRIASFISDEIVKQNLTYVFFNEFQINLSQHVSAEKIKKFLFDEINNMLFEAYYRENNTVATEENPAAANNCLQKMIIGRTNIKKFFITEIATVLNNITDDIEMYITGDIITLLDKQLFFNVFNFSSKNIDIHIGCNIQKLSNENLDFIDKLYNLFNHYIEITFHIHDDKKFQYSNIITVKNHFSLQYSLHNDNLIDICTYITDKTISADIYERTCEKFTADTYLIQPINDIELIKFRSFFYLNNYLLLFCAKGFEFFLPPQAFKNLLSTSTTYQYSSDMQQTIQNMQITWEEQFEKAHIDFILPAANIMHYIEEGQLSYGEIAYTTSPQERELQLQQLVKSMKNNPHINIFLLGQVQPYNKDSYFKLSYYSNNKTAYLKKDATFCSKNNKNIYLIKDFRLLYKFNDFFSTTIKKSDCSKFTADDIENIYKKNNALLHRIWLQSKQPV